MIKKVSGDILLTSAKATAHGIAPNDHLDHGLALSLRERWPAMAKDFRHYCRTHHPKPGEAWIWSAPDATRIINLLTQEPAPSDGGRPGQARLEHVNHSLRSLRQIVGEEDIPSLAIPKLATGVGGLSWKDVEPLVEQHLGSLNIPVYVYAEYHAGQRAAE